MENLSTFTPGAGNQAFMAPIAQDRLVRKEVSLGTIREIEPPTDHIGLASIAPWLPVATDEVIFDYMKGLSDGLAPARAEDAESQLAQKDDFAGGQGRASVIDWSLKDHYSASDVSRYREYSRMAELLGAGDFPLTINSQTEDFASKIARDDVTRRRKLDNRLEWLIMSALSTGVIAYNDGKIKFSVDFQRPGGQSAQAPASGTYASDTHDPIADLMAIDEAMYAAHGVHITRGIISKKAMLRMARSSKFALRGAIVPDGSGGAVGVDPYYTVPGYGPQYAIDLIQQQTGITFTVYDSVMRTRAIGGTTITNTRFTPENRVILLPDDAQLADYDNTQIGFAKTLTSPHPEGNWAPGFYEWEKERKDPWGTDRGSGVKAFPVFPHMELSYTMDVTL